MAPDKQPLIEIENLHIAFPLEEGVINAVHDVSFSIPRAGTVGLVGESGCGKSMTGLSLLQLVPPPGRLLAGRIRYHCQSGKAGLVSDPIDIAALPPRGDAIRSIRGAEI